ncbi:MAG TPA: Fic family protein [Rhodospirillales bacterium]|nr:Fic family protein [Rhodospirillales bacterium]
MMSFSPTFEAHAPLNHAIVGAIGTIREYRGKEALYRQQAPQVLETLRQVAVIQSVESSNRIEQVIAPPKRIRELVEKKTQPQNRSEQEIAGYRDVLNVIHRDHDAIPFSPNVVLQFHRDLLAYAGTGGGGWKISDNTIAEIEPDGRRCLRFQPLPAYRTAEAMTELHGRFNETWEAGRIEPLLLIAAYVLDFLCIHPFADGNGRMARLLSLLLLYRAGYGVGRFISLERIIEESKESYYETLYACSQGWHEGRHDLAPWTEYFLGVVVRAYGAFEDRVGLITQARGAKSEMVRAAIRTFARPFAVRELQLSCPNVSIDLIRSVLRQEREAGRVEALGRGRDALWARRI